MENMDAACVRALQLIDAAERQLTILSLQASADATEPGSTAASTEKEGASTAPFQLSASKLVTSTRGWYREGLYRVPASTSTKQALLEHMVGALQRSDCRPGEGGQLGGDLLGLLTNAGTAPSLAPGTPQLAQGSETLPAMQRSPLLGPPVHLAQPVSFPPRADEEGVTAVVKAYLIGQLPQTLLLLVDDEKVTRKGITDLQAAWMQLSEAPVGRNLCSSARALLAQLHPAAQTLIRAVLYHMKAVTAHASSNQMGDVAISTVLGPCFLSLTPHITDGQSSGQGAGPVSIKHMEALAQRAAAINRLVKTLLLHVDELFPEYCMDEHAPGVAGCADNAVSLSPADTAVPTWPVIPRHLQGEVLATGDGTAHCIRLGSGVQTLLQQRAPRSLQQLQALLAQGAEQQRAESLHGQGKLADTGEGMVNQKVRALTHTLFGLDGYPVPVHAGGSCTQACDGVQVQSQPAQNQGAATSFTVANAHDGMALGTKTGGKPAERRKSWAAKAVQMLTGRTGSTKSASRSRSQSRRASPEAAIRDGAVLASGDGSPLIGSSNDLQVSIQRVAEEVTAALLCLQSTNDEDKEEHSREVEQIVQSTQQAGSQRSLPRRQRPGSPLAAPNNSVTDHTLDGEGETGGEQQTVMTSSSARSLPGRAVLPSRSPLAAANTAIDHLLDHVLHSAATTDQQRLSLAVGAVEVDSAADIISPTQASGLPRAVQSLDCASGSVKSSSASSRGSRHQYMHSLTSALSGPGLQSPMLIHASGYPYTGGAGPSAYAGQTSSETYELLVRDSAGAQCARCSVLQHRVVELEHEVSSLRRLVQYSAWADPSSAILDAAAHCHLSTEEMAVVNHLCAVLRRSNAVSVTTTESSGSSGHGLKAAPRSPPPAAVSGSPSSM